MVPPGHVRLAARNGVEIWRLTDGGAERFAVAYAPRRARTVATLAAAEALFSHHVSQAELVRAH